MITEAGRVVAIEADGLWVETIQRSTCSSCAAEKGCGQGLIARWGGHTSYLRVLLEGRDPEAFQVNDEITIAIPEDVVVKGSLFAYLLPLVLLLVGSGLGQQILQTDLASALGGLAGIALGAALVRWRAWVKRDDRRLQPVIDDSRAAVQAVKIVESGGLV